MPPTPPSPATKRPARPLFLSLPLEGEDDNLLDTDSAGGCSVGVGGRGEVVVEDEEAAAPAALVVLVQATLAMISRTCSLCHAVT